MAHLQDILQQMGKFPTLPEGKIGLSPHQKAGKSVGNPILGQKTLSLSLVLRSKQSRSRLQKLPP